MKCKSDKIFGLVLLCLQQAENYPNQLNHFAFFDFGASSNFIVSVKLFICCKRCCSLCSALSALSFHSETRFSASIRKRCSNSNCCCNRFFSAVQLCSFNAFWTLFRTTFFFFGRPKTRLISAGSMSQFSSFESNFLLIFAWIVVREIPQFLLASVMEIHME